MIVCIKQVVDPEAPPSNYRVDASSNRIIPPSGVPVVDPYGEFAVEAALRVKDAVEGKITALSLGSGFRLDVVKKPLAMGADDLVKGFLISAHLVSYTAGNMLNTALIRRVNTSLLVSLSFLIFGAGCVGAALSYSMTMLFAFTVTIGFANGFRYPTLMGLAIAQVDPEERSTAMGIHQAVYALGMFAGPWLAGLIADAVGLRLMFVVVSGVCVVLAHALLGLQARFRRA